MLASYGINANAQTPYGLSNQTNGIDTMTLPDLGGEGLRFVDSTEHKSVGQWSLQQLNGSVRTLEDAWSQEVLEHMAWDINAYAGLPAPLALVLVDSPQINAFAIPGGVVGINAGTVLEANSMDEVASVVAHEFAHLSQRHYEQRQDASKQAMMMQIGGMLAAIAAASAGGEGGNAAAAMMAGSQTLALESQMAFSRSNEREADRVGMALMTKAGYDPKAMPQFFATLNAQSQLNSSRNRFLPSFIMTHPLSNERMSEAESRAQVYARQSYKNTISNSEALQKQRTIQFDLLKWRLAVLTNQTTENELKVAGENSLGARLALAYWYAMMNRFGEANATLQTARSQLNQGHALKSSVEPLFSITQAEILRIQDEPQSAVQLLAPLQRLYPERRDLKIELALAYLDASKLATNQQAGQQSATQVIALVRPLVNNQPHDVQSLRLLEQAYAELARQADTAASKTIATVQSLRYRSLKQLWHGQYDSAQVSITQAINLSEQAKDTENVNTAPLVATLNADLARIKKAKDFKP